MDENETVEQIHDELKRDPLAPNGAKPWTHYLAERILAAHNRKIAAHKRDMAAKDAEIAQLKACRDGECERIKLGAEPCAGCHVQVSNDEIEKLRALVKELADALDSTCNDLAEYTMVDDGIDALVAKAREVCK